VARRPGKNQRIWFLIDLQFVREQTHVRQDSRDFMIKRYSPAVPMVYLDFATTAGTGNQTGPIIAVSWDGVYESLIITALGMFSVVLRNTTRTDINI